MGCTFKVHIRDKLDIIVRITRLGGKYLMTNNGLFPFPDICGIGIVGTGDNLVTFRLVTYYYFTPSGGIGGIIIRGVVLTGFNDTLLPKHLC